VSFRRTPQATLFPYTTLFRSISGKVGIEVRGFDKLDDMYNPNGFPVFELYEEDSLTFKIDVDRVDFKLGRFLLSHTYSNSFTRRSEEHTSELQSRENLVCRLL